jgi:hypothetical protein
MSMLSSDLLRCIGDRTITRGGCARVWSLLTMSVPGLPRSTLFAPVLVDLTVDQGYGSGSGFVRGLLGPAVGPGCGSGFARGLTGSSRPAPFSMCLGCRMHLLSKIGWGPVQAGHFGLSRFVQSLVWCFSEQMPHLAGFLQWLCLCPYELQL